MGVKFRAEMIRPTSLTPSQFPVSQSFTLAATHQFSVLPEAVRRLFQHTTPEEIAQRGKRPGSGLFPPGLWMLGYNFLVGREILIDLEELTPKDQTDDITLVLDFWRRLITAYRSDGHLDNSEAGSTHLGLPATTVQRLYQALIPVDPGIQRQVRQFCSTLEEYLFLLNAEACLGIADSGPYPLNIERVLIVRDFVDLAGAYYRWHDAAAHPPYHTCSLAFTLDPGDFQSIEFSDRAMLLTTPPEYLEAIREIALVTHDSGTLRILPFTEMDRLARLATKAQPKLSAWFTRLSKREWIIAGARPWVLRPLAWAMREEEDRLAWNPAPEALRLLPSYEDDARQAARWATHRCLAQGNASAFVPLG